MMLEQLAHRVAREWMPDSAPDSGRVIALMVSVKLALIEAVAGEREACAEVADGLSHEGIAMRIRSRGEQ